ncbi:hypothetical protein [Streptomyces bambusae]|uniref:Lipoprotein n=1 Tax=Streptomyces bambusae TaxID=1550616 RepID=A0ABS6Z494_9ACTN|nr:hypothetical protein [Streptomyces bambusae]MBW5482593.1 hypothetical protein [Streptomyces bambusae]
MSPRTRALPALLITGALALSLSACGSSAAPTKPADPAALAAEAAPGASLPAGATPTARTKQPRHTPAAGSLPASLAPSGKSKLAVVTPAGASGGATEASTPDLTLTSYDARTGEAVLAPAPNADKGAQDKTPQDKGAQDKGAQDKATPGTPQKPGSGPADPGKNKQDTPAPAAPAAAAVRPGQLIDSPPTPAAPRGALVAVTAVRQADGGKTAVSTRPATVSELLGNASAALNTALDARTIDVQPQVKDLKVSFTKRADGGNGSVTTGLKLDANATVPLPQGASASLSGSIEIDPSVEFSYQGKALSPQQASVGFELGARANWRVHAGLSAAKEPVRIPLAKLGASPVVMVGHLPVVINLDLTLYAKIAADGTISLDAEQQLAADWGIHSDYTKGKGWTTDVDPGTTTISPVRATLSGKASVRTGLAVEGSVALYDAVGLKATLEPHLRADADGTVTITSGGAAPTVTGKAGLYGGLDIDGALMARIAVLGTPLFEKELPFQVFHREWPIVVRGTTPANPGPTPTPTPTPSASARKS